MKSMLECGGLYLKLKNKFTRMPQQNNEDLRWNRLMKKSNPKGLVKNFTTKEKIVGDDFKEKGDYIVTYSPRLSFDKNYKHETKNIARFLETFFVLNDKHETVNVATGETFCMRGKRRSIVDIFLIARSYFPRIGLRTVIREITLNKEVSSNLCQMTSKRVYYIRKGDSPRHVHTEQKDEFGITLLELQQSSKI